MKKSEKHHPEFTEIHYDELVSIHGGSFAYDLGRLLRYVAIYYANGTGATGTAAANADYLANLYLNGQW